MNSPHLLKTLTLIKHCVVVSKQYAVAEAERSLHPSKDARSKPLQQDDTCSVGRRLDEYDYEVKKPNSRLMTTLLNAMVSVSKLTALQWQIISL